MREANRKIVILSFNIWKGGGGKYENDHKNDPVISKPSRDDILPVYKSIADLILREKADIVALQEVDCDTARIAYLDAAKKIATLLDAKSNPTKWSQCFFKAKTIGKDPGKHHKKEYGNAILSSLTWRNPKAIDLGNTGLHEKDSENRIAMMQEFVIPNGSQEIRLLVINLHLGLERDNQIFQLARLKELVDAADNNSKPIIICGDFNIDALGIKVNNPKHISLTLSELKRILDQFKRKFEDQIPTTESKTTFGNKRIDYFFFSDTSDPRFKDKLKCDSVGVVEDSGKNCSSDHNALKLTLTL